MHAALLILMLALGQTSPVGGDDLGIVRGHYASAAYEAALAHLDGLDAARITPSLQQYRALCLLALGRVQEGEAAFERLVRQSPRFVIPEGDIAPHLFVMFRDVRRRVLPSIAQDGYDRGKTHLEAGRFTEAVEELREARQLLDDPDLSSESERTADLRQLTDGFLRLAELSASADSRPTAAATDGAASPTPGAAPAEVTDPVYSAADADVTPPTEVSRTMPVWDPPAVMARYLEYRGEIDVVIDQHGRVAQADITRPTIPSYDGRLIDATSTWRFEPARRQGTPVKFRQTYSFALTPRP